MKTIYKNKDRAKLRELMDEGHSWDYISSYMRGWLKAATPKVPKKVTRITRKIRRVK